MIYYFKEIMKKSGHPTYYQAKVTCACGNTFVIGSTLQEISVDICAKCHPFYTGQMKFVDTMGRVEKFQKKQKHAQKTVAILLEKKKKKQENMEAKERQPKSLREMLLGIQ